MARRKSNLDFERQDSEFSIVFDGIFPFRRFRRREQHITAAASRIDMVAKFVLGGRKTAGKIVMFTTARSLHYKCVGKIKGHQGFRGALVVEVAINYSQAGLLWLKSNIVFWISRPPGVDLGGVLARFFEPTANSWRLSARHNREYWPAFGSISQCCQVLLRFI